MKGKPVFFFPELRDPKALLLDLIGPEGELREGGVRKLSEDELIRLAPEWDALLITSREQITGRVIEAAARLKIIAKIGVGVENIDIPAATCRRIPVTNCPGQNAVAVAEAALALMLSATRRIPQYMHKLQEGAWREVLTHTTELTGATFGVVGFGNIGRELARLLRGFDGRILAYDPFLKEDRIRSGGAEPSGLDRLTREADLISLHCNLTPETRHMFGADRFRMMKPSAFIVNCSRGAVIDEAALAEALKSGEIAGAGIDVYEEEPPVKNNPLFSLPNAVVTPHFSGGTRQARERICRSAVENALRAVRGEEVDPGALLNPEVYEK